MMNDFFRKKYYKLYKLFKKLKQTSAIYTDAATIEQIFTSIICFTFHAPFCKLQRRSWSISK